MTKKRFELFLIGGPFWLSAGKVALGELTVMIVSYIFYMLLKRNKGFFEVIRANRNMDFKF